MSLDPESIVEFLSTNCGIDHEDLTHDTPLFSSGMLDSFMMVELIVFLEAAAGRRMKPTDIQLDNLDTIQRILGFFGDGP